MRTRSTAFFAAGLAAALIAAPAMTQPGGHVLKTPDAIAWGPAPASLPAGAEAALLYGDPAGEGVFILRLRLPAGYHIPPHMAWSAFDQLRDRQ
jgi:hypothetical protein